MRKKIKQLAYGIFDYAGVSLSFSTERIELEIVEGKDASGEFIIHSEKKIRGIVYSTHTRMECLTPQFEGREISIRYQFHSEGLVDGDIRKGEFVIVCDQGEYNLSFVVSICKSYAKTSIGKIKTMSDFVHLARESYTEAYQVFYSKSFKNILEDAESEEGLFYKAIRKEAPSRQAVEAYLVGIEKKPPVHISLEEEECNFYGVTASRKEQLHLTKDHWGYFKGNVKTDTPFIRLSKEQITPEDFLGSTCFYDYYIEAEALHAGKNYGRIVFEFPNDSLVCELCISTTAEDVVADVSEHHRHLKYKTELMQCYIDYRTKKIVTGVWAKKSIELLNKLADMEPENELYRLMKAQAFLVNRQRQEASWILEEYKRACTDKYTPEWGYYLYLCTLMEREESYVNRLLAQIEELFQEYSDSSLLFWVLLFMREEYYRSNARRLKAVEEWITKGCDSPYFYVEAFYLYCQDPYLLAKLGTFEIKILNWAAKHRVISKEVANQIISLIPTTKFYDEKIVRILEACYEAAEKEEVVAAICSYLIKGQRFEKKYHKWYIEGIRNEVRITNLYEAYLLSADKESIKQVPKEIFMYFQYHNTLSYKQLALLYAYIIQNKEKYKKVYQNYRRTIEQFAVSQIEAGHMDENLAVIYQEMLPMEILNCELAEKFANVLFVRKLCITNEKNFYKAIVVQRQWKQRQIVSVVDGVAYFSAFSEDYVILLQDAKGQLFAEKSLYIEERLLDVNACLEVVEKLAPMAVPCLIYSFNEKYKKNAFLETDIECFSILMDSEEVRTAWKGVLCPLFIRYLMKMNSEDNLTSCIKNVDYNQMSAEDRGFMIEQLIAKHQFEMAYDLLCVYGSDVIGADYRMSICSYKITACDYEEDEFLLGMSSETFALDKYNDVILSYLCRYYNGPTKRMVAIWKAASAFRIDTFDMEERIITQTLYSTEYVEDINAIYEAYCEKGGNDLIFMAYLSYYSHLYLVKDVVVPVEIFLQMENRMFLRKEMTDVQKFALLKSYAEKGRLTETEYKIADELLLECTCKNVYFAYYKKLDRDLQIKYHLQDKYFVEYHSKQGANVSVSYYINENNLKEETLEEVYPGIFVKSFLLFAGDNVSYYIAEQDMQKGRNVTLSGQLECDAVYGEEEQGRYTMLNRIWTQIKEQESDAAKQMMKQYARRQAEVAEIFTLL